MRRTPILLVVILLMMINLAHTGNKPQSIINKGEIVNVATNNTSRVIVGDGATIIIRSTDETNPRILATVVDLSRGGVIKELLNGEVLIEEPQIAKETEQTLNQEVTLPMKFTVNKAYPNPFNPIMNVQFGLPEESRVHINIYDVTGRLVGDYNIGNRSAGWHEFRWNTSDMNGNDIGAGIYIIAIQAGDLLQKQKVTYIK